ncbi:unnamed protein product [Phytophthora fragariaefolia]|uniref:Unnamed protein product n=1 Tax=Phytophthora fragariaefolia TaxID=1490495 RepID=A0A9W7D547_9STRA|nr:unnamed protein product [Phytophthora fragariaefolia]
MRELFHRFPEVVMIDATYGTNLSKYKVFSIMAYDALGKGQFVQHAVIPNERIPTLSMTLEEFKRNNPAWSRINCILINKDFGEISVLKKAFPDARLLLCQFHVLKYLREQIASKDYGFTSWQKQQLDGLMNLLVYARTERQYFRLRKYMRHIMDVGTGKKTIELTRFGEIELSSGRAELGTVGGGVGPCLGAVGSSVGRQMGAVRDEMCSEQECVPATGEDRVFNHPFEDYFVRIWDNCRQMWCAFER